MISVIHYPATNSVEVTWLEVTETPAPFIEGHDIYVPPTVTTKPIRCHSYADMQMDMLEADLGVDASEHAALIATVRANIVPPASPVPPTAAQQLAQLDADNQLTQRNLRETVMLMAEAFKQLSGGAVDLTALPGVAKVYEVEAQALALRAQL